MMQYKEIDNRIVAMLEEYMDTFMVVGYRPNGEKCRISKYHTNMEADALQQGMEDVLDKYKIPPEVIIKDDK